MGLSKVSFPKTNESLTYFLKERKRAMKYRQLNTNEIEAYNIGYKVGSRQIIITDIEWETENEHKIYRKGYMAGLMDYKRKVNNVSNVSNVSNVDIATPTTPIGISINNNINNNNKLSGINNNISTTRTRANEDKKLLTPHNMLEIFGNSLKGTDAVVDVFEKSDGTTKEGIRIKNLALLAFVRQRFNKKTLERVSDWAIDHNQRGYTYNASSLLKLFCKFQRDIEPTINYNHVQLEYLKFDYKGEKSSGNTTIS